MANNLFTGILLIFSVLITTNDSQDVNNIKCPDCSTISCVTSLLQGECPSGQVLKPNAGICGCCPACSGGKKFRETLCTPSFGNDPTRECTYGLTCVSGRCALDRTKCAHTNHLNAFYKLKWIPECDKNGEYKAKMCKGDRASGRCFCFDLNGQRIFGWDWWRSSEDMTCTCSRLRKKLEDSGHISTIHCEQNGNFEELQCDSKICWCAEPKTGKLTPGTIAVPESLWTMLPCYNITSMGTSYLRQCESGAYNQKLMLKTLNVHGTTGLAVRNIRCDYDGNYANYIVENGAASCTWKDGTRIGSYQVEAANVLGMNCNCARDQKYFEESGLSLTVLCSGNGNYQTLQEQNGEVFCLDGDGFAMTDLLPSTTPNLDCANHIHATIPNN